MPVRPWSTCCCWPPSKVCPARSSLRPWNGRTCAGRCETRCRAPPMYRWFFASATGPGPRHTTPPGTGGTRHAALKVGSALDVHDTFHGPDEARVMARTRHAAFSAGHFGLRTVHPARSAVPFLQDLSGPPPPDRVLVLALLRSEVHVGQCLLRARDPMAPERADPPARARHLRADDAGGRPCAGVVGGGPYRLPVGGLGVDQGGVARCGCARRACGDRARDPRGRRTPMDAVQRTVTSAGARPAAAENRACSPLRTIPRDNQVSASPAPRAATARRCSRCCRPARAGGVRMGPPRSPRSAPCASSSADGSMAS